MRKVLPRSYVVGSDQDCDEFHSLPPYLKASSNKKPPHHQFNVLARYVMLSRLARVGFLRGAFFTVCAQDEIDWFKHHMASDKKPWVRCIRLLLDRCVTIFESSQSAVVAEKLRQLEGDTRHLTMLELYVFLWESIHHNGTLYVCHSGSSIMCPITQFSFSKFLEYVCRMITSEVAMPLEVVAGGFETHRLAIAASNLSTSTDAMLTKAFRDAAMQDSEGVCVEKRDLTTFERLRLRAIAEELLKRTMSIHISPAEMQVHQKTAVARAPSGRSNVSALASSAASSAYAALVGTSRQSSKRSNSNIYRIEPPSSAMRRVSMPSVSELSVMFRRSMSISTTSSSSRRSFVGD